MPAWSHSPTSSNIIYIITNQYPGMTRREHAEKNDHHEVSKVCKVCSSTADHESRFSFFGVCDRCGYKILIILFIVSIVISYTVWFGIF
jgi:hypothetical protein